MKLVITEKPSVAQTIAKVIGAYKREDGYLEGGGYIVSWCIGHLVGLAQPDNYDGRFRKWNTEDLPIIPDEWLWLTLPDKERQFNILKGLMSRKDVDELICATDAGREGELIFRLVYQKAGCDKPFKRLWISSMEDSAIKDGFENLRDGAAYDHLYQAALCRSKADWLVGINATRLFTTLYNKRLTVGRVQTPTLAMLVERQQQISDFKKEKYFNIHLRSGDLHVVKEKVFSEEEADSIRKACDGSEAVVTNVKQEKKTVNPPALYDLTTLQRESNRNFGMTAKVTLDVLQRLYEKKLVTYPRTDSQFITEDMGETMLRLLQMAERVFNFASNSGCAPDIKRVTNNAKVSDHHAILLTIEVEKATGLSEDEQKILALIAQRMICATSQPHEYVETEITMDCSGYEFRAKGKTVTTVGWKAINDSFKKRYCKSEKKKESAPALPAVSKGQPFSVAASTSEHFTTPPKAFTEDTLLSAMETAGNEDFADDTEKKGLGTPATRAAMIEKLISSQYVQRNGKQLIPTDDGIKLASLMPEEIKSPKLTADWENALMQIERGDQESATFMSAIAEMVSLLVEKYKALPDSERQLFGVNRTGREIIGKCPHCGSLVYEGKSSFYCSNQDCDFKLWKESNWLSGMGKKLTKKMAQDLLENGRIHVSGLYSRKAGKFFDADFVLDNSGEHGSIKLDFSNSKKGSAKRNGVKQAPGKAKSKAK